MKYFLLFSFAFLFSISIYSQNFQPKKAGICYTLDIPNYMTKTFELNDNASLQYTNTLKEAYVIVIEDSKEELQSLGMVFMNAKDFLDNFVNEYQLASPNRTITPIVEFVENTYNHAQVEMSWTSEDSDLYMVITSVETQGHFYKILCWTLLEYKDTFRNDYLTISKSLKE